MDDFDKVLYLCIFSILMGMVSAVCCVIETLT